jgi:hypothetical protein
MVDMTKVGTLLGKCSIDGLPVYTGTGDRSKYATWCNGKLISGDTLINLYPQTFEAWLSHNQDAEQESKNLLEKLDKYGWQVDPETGKLKKLVATKTLNSPETIGEK